MTAPVLQMKQKRERVRPDGLPKSSSSDDRKEKQSSNTCQALNGMNWGWWTRSEAGQDATTVQAVVAEGGGFARQSACSVEADVRLSCQRGAHKTKGIKDTVHGFKDEDACLRARELPKVFRWWERESWLYSGSSSVSGR